MEGGSGGNDRELLSKTLQFEHKLFYFDLKQNPRGQYLKISEKTAATRSTIIVPALEGIQWFIELFHYYVSTDEREICSKELKLDTKVYYFDMGENKRGRFLKVSEASANRNRSTIIIPAGSSDEGWTAFKNILQEIYDEASEPFTGPNQLLASPEDLPGLSDDVGAGFISGRSTQPISGVDLTADRLSEMHLQDETGGSGLPNYIRVDQKRFYFDLGNNNRGHFLRISEVAGMDRSSIILPLSGLKQFHEMVGRFVEMMKETIDEVSGPNVRTLEPALG